MTPERGKGKTRPEDFQTIFPIHLDKSGNIIHNNIRFSERMLLVNNPIILI